MPALMKINSDESDLTPSTTESDSPPTVNPIYSQHLAKISKFNGLLKSHLQINLFEFGLLLYYPCLIFLGQVVYWLNWIFGNQDQLLNYFTSKRNLVNVIFVKQGWFWTTVVFAGLIYSKFKFNKTQAVVPSVINYGLATTWWIFFTQWFFGLPLMDRIFFLTGGACQNISHSSKLVKYIEANPGIKNALKELEIESGSYLSPGIMIPKGIDVENELLKYEAKFSSKVCRKLGGQWLGGHDPSGHCFLLIHSSFLIWFEVLPILNDLILDLYSNNPIFHKLLNKLDFYAKKEIVLKNQNENTLISLGKILIHPLFTSFSLLALWSWMLFITSIYFHSIFEILAGTLAGYLEILVVVLGKRFL